MLHTGRRLLRVQGVDSFALLQSLISNDLRSIRIFPRAIRDCRKLESNPILYTFLLNNRGRVVHDSFIYREDGHFLVECDGDRLEQLKKLLEFYRMRKRVEVSVDGRAVLAVTDESSPSAIADPRTSLFPARRLISSNADSSTHDGEYRRLRYHWGLPEGWSETNEQLPTMLNGDLLDGLSDNKGCYIGQELVARALHGGVTRRRTLPFTASGLIEKGQLPVMDGNTQVGKVIASEETSGLVQVSPTFVDKQLTVGGTIVIVPHLPPWWEEKVK